MKILKNLFLIVSQGEQEAFQKKREAFQEERVVKLKPRHKEVLHPKGVLP